MSTTFLFDYQTNHSLSPFPIIEVAFPHSCDYLGGKWGQMADFNFKYYVTTCPLTSISNFIPEFLVLQISWPSITGPF